MKNAAIAAGACLTSILALCIGHALGTAERAAEESLSAREANERIRRLQDQLAGAGNSAPVVSDAPGPPLNLGGALADAQRRLDEATKKLAALEGEARAALEKAQAKANELVSQVRQEAAAGRATLQRGQAQALAAKDGALRDAKGEAAKLRGEVRSLREEVRKLNDRLGKLEAIQKIKIPRW